VLMAVFLAWPDLYRVAGVLVLNRPASPVTLSLSRGRPYV